MHMTIRERFEAFLKGEKPDKIPYTIAYCLYNDFSGNPVWKKYFDRGMGVTETEAVYKTNFRNGVEPIYSQYTENGNTIVRSGFKTPIGEIYKLYQNGWETRMLLHDENDYKIMNYVSKNTYYSEDFEAWRNWESSLAAHQIPSTYIGRTPMQRILVDFVGLEEFGFHMSDYEDEFLELYDNLNANFTQLCEITASSDALWIACLENFSSETLGPSRFEKYHIPVYNKCFSLFNEAGKYVSTHYDGRLDNCKELIAKAPMPIIESLTEPPEGDMMYDKCREYFKDKRFMANINLETYELSKNDLIESVINKARRASSDGTKLLFEISEDLPRNFATSLDYVLDALDELKY